jgi:hypothetical protein
MNKYSSLTNDVNSIFASANWQSEGIETHPQNFVGSAVNSSYVRVSVVASGSALVNPPRSAAGMLIIDIFVPAGEGTALVDTIADKLDKYLAGRVLTTTLNGTTQLGSSTLVHLGNDKANPALYRSSFSISFNYFGK